MIPQPSGDGSGFEFVNNDLTFLMISTLLGLTSNGSFESAGGAPSNVIWFKHYGSYYILKGPKVLD